MLDCQSDLLSDLNTRFVVPLLLESAAPKPASRLNPVLEFRNERLVMVTQFAAAISVRELGEHVGSLLICQDEIGNALDMLITGF